MVGSQDNDLLSACFKEVTGAFPSSICPLRPHASERRIYRLSTFNTSIIGVINGCFQENDAFVALAHHFRHDGLPVPNILLFRPEHGAYLQEDFGDTTLLTFLERERQRTSEEFPSSVMDAYKETVAQLPLFQIRAARTLNFDLCYPKGISYAQALRRDFQVFKSDLVHRLLPTFDTSNLDNDFAELVTFLSQAESEFFMYSDFQARNVMLRNGSPHFIDFQGGKRGPLQYDVASLLHQISARIPEAARHILLQHYIQCIRSLTPISSDRFHRFYPTFVVTRMLQVLGIYGGQGLGAGKEYFSSSIPGALSTLARELEEPDFPLNLSKLLACVHSLRNDLTQKISSAEQC